MVVSSSWDPSTQDTGAPAADERQPAGGPSAHGAALMVRPHDELVTLDRYQPFLEHFGPRG